jgi:hypothetical protein
MWTEYQCVLYILNHIKYPDRVARLQIYGHIGPYKLEV